MIFLGREWNKNHTKKICKWMCNRNHQAHYASGGPPRIIVSIKIQLFKPLVDQEKIFYQGEEQEAYIYGYQIHKEFKRRPIVKSVSENRYIKYKSLKSS